MRMKEFKTKTKQKCLKTSSTTYLRYIHHIHGNTTHYKHRSDGDSDDNLFRYSLCE